MEKCNQDCNLQGLEGYGRHMCWILQQQNLRYQGLTKPTGLYLNISLLGGLTL